MGLPLALDRRDRRRELEQRRRQALDLLFHDDDLLDDGSAAGEPWDELPERGLSPVEFEAGCDRLFESGDLHWPALWRPKD